MGYKWSSTDKGVLMKIIKPEEITITEYTSTNLVDEAYPDWTAGSTFTGAGTFVIYDDRYIYQTLAPTSDEPPVGATSTTPTWLLMGQTNSWRLFDGSTGSYSSVSAGGTLSAQISLSTYVTGIALFGLQGDTANITVTDGTAGIVYQAELDITDAGADNWFDFYFADYDVQSDFVLTDIPPYDGITIDLSVTSTAPTGARVALFVAGKIVDLGVANYGTSIKTIDYSTREVDGFGNYTIIPRKKVKSANYDCYVFSDQISTVRRELDAVSTIPVVYIGSEVYESTFVVGYYRDWEINISSPTVSDMTLSVEGV